MRLTRYYHTFAVDINGNQVNVGVTSTSILQAQKRMKEILKVTVPRRKIKIGK